MDEIDDFIMYLQGKREITHKLMKEKQNQHGSLINTDNFENVKFD